MVKKIIKIILINIFYLPSMSLFELLMKNFPEYVISLKNDVICVKSEEESSFDLDLLKRLGIFSFKYGTVIVHLPNPESSNYNDEMIQLITQVLSNKGLSTNYGKTIAAVRAILFQVQRGKNLILCVTELGNMRLSTNLTCSNHIFIERDKIFLSEFLADSDNYRSGRQTTYSWNHDTSTLSENYNGRCFNAGPHETVDSLFAMIISEIYRFVDHITDMRSKRIGRLDEGNMERHMQKPYNTSEQLESENKKRIVEFCDIHPETFSPILVQDKDFSDVEEETGDETPSLGKRTRSCE